MDLTREAVAGYAMTEIDAERLKPWARKYIWWQTPDEAVRRPLRVIAQVMDIGDYDDVQELLATFGEAPFKQTIACAEAGQFRDRSWAYWHYRLGLATPGGVPAVPKRQLS